MMRLDFISLLNKGYASVVYIYDYFAYVQSVVSYISELRSFNTLIAIIDR